MVANHYRDKNQHSCEVVFQRQGYDVESLYWVGSMEEVRELAEEIASRRGANTYRIVELSGNDPVNNIEPPRRTRRQFRLWKWI
jgi:hypothetical protein